MKNILSGICGHDIGEEYGYKIVQRKTADGKPYFCVSEPCSGDVAPNSADLVGFEWDTNEVYLNEINLKTSVSLGLGIKNVWKSQMEREFPKTAFDICMLVDMGDEEIPPSVTLRFWAVRDGVHYINPTQEEVDTVKQPVLMKKVNY